MSIDKKKSAASVLIFYLALLNLIIIFLAISARLLLDLSPSKAFYPFFYALQFGLILAVLSVVQFAYALLKSNQRLKRYALLSLIAGVLPLLGAVLTAGIAGFKAPMIHDISSDTKDPPVFSIIASLRSAEENSLDYGGEAIASLQQQSYPDITTLSSDLSPEQAFARAQESVAGLGWTLVVADEEALRLEAYDKSKLFGFIDDVSVRITGTNGGSLVDIRSVSRIGKGDLGANAERIRRFFESFRSEL